MKYGPVWVSKNRVWATNMSHFWGNEYIICQPCMKFWVILFFRPSQFSANSWIRCEISTWQRLGGLLSLQVLTHTRNYMRLTSVWVWFSNKKNWRGFLMISYVLFFDVAVIHNLSQFTPWAADSRLWIQLSQDDLQLLLLWRVPLPHQGRNVQHREKAIVQQLDGLCHAFRLRRPSGRHRLKNWASQSTVHMVQQRFTMSHHHLFTLLGYSMDSKKLLAFRSKLWWCRYFWSMYQTLSRSMKW